MSLRIKTRIIVTATLLGLLATLYLVTRHTLLPRFAELEDAEVRADTDRASMAIWHEAALLNSTVRDDAIWDEAYTFVQNHSVEWVSSSFSDDGYRYLRLNLMVYSDVNDDPVWAREFDPAVGKQVSARPEILPILRRLAHRARTSGTLAGISGIIRLPDGPMVISAAPVLPSSGRGTALGSLVMGRRLDAAELADLAKNTNLPIATRDYDDPNLPPDFAMARTRLERGDGVVVQELSPDSIAGFSVLKDIDGRPVLLIRTEDRRAIFHQGKATLVYLMIAALIVGIAFSLVTLVLFEKLVVSRLIGLSSSVGGVAAQPHRTARVAVEGSDEVSQLGVAINRMLTALANSQEKHQLQSAFLEQLFESAPEAIAILDRDDVVMRVNQEFCRMFGYTSEEVVGRSIADLIATDDQREHATLLAREVAAGKTISLEARRRKKDGRWLDVSILGTPITTDAGQVAVYAIYRDVGEKKRSEALQTALYQIAEKASSTEDLPQLYTAIHSILRRLMYAKNCYIAEYDPATDLVSFPYFVDEKDPPFPPHKFGHGFTEYVLRTGQPLLATADVLEDLIRRGEVHRIGSASSDWLGVPLKQADKVFGVLTVQSYDPKVRYTDKDKEILTFVSQQIASAIAQKRNQEAVRISEANFRSLAENASPAIFIYDERRFLYVNPSSERMFGYTRQELLAMSDPWEIIDPESREIARQMASAKNAGEVAPKGEFRIVKKSGDSRWVELSTSVIQFGGKPANVATAIDITERKRSEQLQSALYQIANLSSTTGDLPSLYRSIHQIVGELMDAKNFYIALADFRSETIEFPYFVDEVDLVPPEAPLAIGRGLTGYVLHTGEPLLATPEVFEQLVKSGDVESVGAPSVDWLGVPLKKGDQTFGVLVVQSYTENVRYGQRDKEILTFVSQQVASAIEHRRDQDALRASEARYRTLVEGAEYGIFQSTLENRFIDANPALVEMLGYSGKEEVLALHVGRDVYAESAQRDQILARLKEEGRFRGVEARWKRRDGTVMTVRLSGRTFTDTTGEIAGFEGIAEDITERRLLEDQLRQSQKMEAVGQLAGGIAHDFNNLLTIIKGNSELLLDDLGETDPRRVEVDEIQKAASRAAGMTQQLLAFSRRQVRAPKVLDLNQVVTNMEKLLHRLLGEQVELCTVCAKDLSSVKADPGQVEQVIMNLALNARDAMPSGGKLTIETANVDLDESYDREHFNVKPGKYVLLAVSDTGEGMDAETLAHAFEPFFTTKPVGKGTGLGLSTVYGIVKQSDGYIWGYSEVGIGTTFKVYLPCTQTAVQDTHMPRPVKDYEGSEQILVVEDEDGVRGLICQVLRRKGYTVIEARNGQEAIAACSQNGSRGPDLLVTDVVLPQMSGREIADRVTAMIPDVRVLYISGYTDDAVLKHGVLNTGTAFLQKPFTTEALLEKVREVLRMPRSAAAKKKTATHV